jgi:hypothetical protein
LVIISWKGCIGKAHGGRKVIYSKKFEVSYHCPNKIQNVPIILFYSETLIILGKVENEYTFAYGSFEKG